MNQSNEHKLQTLIDDLKVTLSGYSNEGIVRYLLAGIADGFSYGGDLSSDLFFRYFYIPIDRPIEQHHKSDKRKYNQKSDYIGDTLKKFEEKHLLYILQGPAGSGKSTLVNYLVYSANRTGNNHLELVNFDCALDRGMYDTEIHFPVNQFVEKYKNMDNAMRKNPEWKERFKTILYRLKHVYLDLNNGFLRYFFSRIRESYTFDCDDCLKLIVSFQDRKLNLHERTFLLAFLLILYMSRADNQKKYVFFMDNLEMYIYRSDQPVQSLKTSLRDINFLFIKLASDSMLQEFFSASSLVDSFVFVMCLRTATRITDEKTYYAGDSVHDGEFDVEKLDIPLYDFSVRAIRKKLVFLKQYLPEKLEAVTNFVDPLYKISSEKKIEKDVFSFSQRHYIPFNNYNYRIAIRNLENVSKYREEIDILNAFQKKLPNGNSYLKSFAVNGTRMLVYRSRYEYLQQNGFMKALGIDDVDVTHFPGNTRHILSFIFFYERLNGRRVPYADFNKLILTNRKKGGFKSIAEAISVLGPTSTSLIKEESLRRWGSLIEISGVQNIHELQRELEKTEDSENVFVYLTPAGEDYVVNESKQFEYFVSRIIDGNGKPRHRPLFAHLNLDTIPDAITLIEDVLIQVKNAVMSLDGPIECKRTCNIESCPRVFSENPKVCTRIVKTYEMFAVIKMYIDYIDRYRTVLIAKLCQDLKENVPGVTEDSIIRINNELLDLLEKYNGSYDSIEQMLSNVMIQGKYLNELGLNLYEYMIQITQAVIEKTNYRTIYPQYYWLIFGETVKSGQYPYKTNTGGFRRIIDKARITKISDKTMILPLARFMSRDAERE